MSCLLQRFDLPMLLNGVVVCVTIRAINFSYIFNIIRLELMTTVASFNGYLMTDNLWSSFTDEKNPVELPNTDYSKIMFNGDDVVAVAGDFTLIHQFKRWFYGEDVFDTELELAQHIGEMSIIWYDVSNQNLKYMNKVMPYLVNGEDEHALITTGSGAPFFISALESSGFNPFEAIIKSKQLDRATGGKTVYFNLSDASDNNLPANHADVAACLKDLEEQLMKLNADKVKILASLQAPIGLPTSLKKKPASEASALDFLRKTGRKLKSN